MARFCLHANQGRRTVGCLRGLERGGELKLCAGTTRSSWSLVITKVAG
jgi:hypothetical protein